VAPAIVLVGVIGGGDQPIQSAQSLGPLRHADQTAIGASAPTHVSASLRKTSSAVGDQGASRTVAASSDAELIAAGAHRHIARP
jgi:hypothetical protein